MSNILATLGADIGNLYLHNQGVPITLSSTGQAINVTHPVQASQVPSPAMSLFGGTTTTSGPAISSAPVTASIKAIGRWGLAFVAFLCVVMFLKPSEAGWLSLVVVLGALITNADLAKKAGRPTVIQTVLGG